jgi:DNA-binding CsgD family transcriptional regulator
MQPYSTAIAAPIVTHRPPTLEWMLRRSEPRHDIARDRLLLEPCAGAALETISALDEPQRRQLVVVTSNPCPEYALDLWDWQPGALLFGRHTDLDIVRALERVSSGKPRLQPVGLHSVLLPSERLILRYLPGGIGDKLIARRLELSHRTVRNRLVSIFEKLNLENRTQVAMYYTGQWQWLDGYRTNRRTLASQPCAAD